MITIRIFDVDISEKFITFKLDGKDYFIGFRDSAVKGVYNIFVRVDNKETTAEITNAYPPLKEVVNILWQVHFRYWLKRVIRKFRQLHKR